MRESRGKTRHTPGREHETPRSIHRREEYEGEKDNPAQEGGTGGTRRKKPIHSHVTEWEQA
jgi:hypothetical protein